jgi:hypothetical protein
MVVHSKRFRPLDLAMSAQPANNIRNLTGNDVRDQRGRFAPGNIGRPVGAKNKAPAELMKIVRAMGPRAIEKLAGALDKDERWAVELILKYCLPPSRSIEMHGLEPDDIKEAFTAGDLSADETKAIATAMEKLKNVSDLDDLRNRLAELETLLNTQPR